MKYIVSISDKTLTQEEKELLQNPTIDGVILYGRNIGSRQTTQNLTASIKNVNKTLKIYVDEEGGLVSRISHFFPNLSQPYCAQIDMNKVRKYYKERSGILRDLGIDVNFAPVVDLAQDENSIMYKRSYGDKPEIIIELSKICIEEQNKAGIGSCLKHWPGHGKSQKDSHHELPVIDISKNEWESSEKIIFKELINFGVEYIMTGHLHFPQISNEITSISEFWNKNTLRKELDFKGQIIADDIDMKGFPKDITIMDLEKSGIDIAIVTSKEHPIFPANFNS